MRARSQLVQAGLQAPTLEAQGCNGYGIMPFCIESERTSLVVYVCDLY